MSFGFIETDMNLKFQVGSRVATPVGHLVPFSPMPRGDDHFNQLGNDLLGHEKRREQVNVGLPDDELSLEALDHLDVEGALGEGGLGKILQVHDPILQRRLAKKVLKEGDNPALIQRFIAEAQITAQLDHPNIVPVHHLGKGPEGYYYTMKKIEGRSLHALLEDRTKQSHLRTEWPLTRLIEILINVGNALAFAHDRGVIHRDIKPANIMIGSYGEVLVVDWGIAKVIGVEDGSGVLWDSEQDGAGYNVGVTQAGQLLGTPGFMSPEQAKGESDLISPATDVYALGATLYYILTNRIPFENKTGEGHLLAVVHDPLPPPSTIKNTAPPELDAICLKAMAKDPDARFPTAKEFVGDLQNWVAGRPVGAADPGIGTYLLKWIGRNKGIVSLGIAALVVLIVSSSWLIVQNRRTEHQSGRLLSMADNQSGVPLTNEEILTLYNQAIELTPRNPYAVFKRGAYLARVHRTKEAFEDYKRVLQLDPFFEPVFIRRGFLNMGLGKLEAALSDANDLIRLNPTFPMGHQLKYMVLHRMKKLNEALQAINTAISLKPTAFLFERRSTLKKDQGDFPGAINDINQALRIEKGNKGVHYLTRGQLYEHLGKLPKAEEDYATALKINPFLQFAYFHGGTLKKQRGDFSGALADFNRALEIDKNFSSVYLNRANLFYAKKEYTKAIPDYEEYLKRAPNWENSQKIRDRLAKCRRLLLEQAR